MAARTVRGSISDIDLSSADVQRCDSVLAVATFFHCDHRRPRYRGETRWGVPDGRGERFYANGNVYLGQWEAGKRHGYGELRGPRGSLLYAGTHSHRGEGG